MSISSQRREIDSVLDTYRDRLDNIPDERFAETPPGAGWSYAEVYSHVLQATLASTIALEKCTLSNCRPALKGLSFWGVLIFALGRFPPVKVKQPDTVAAAIPAKKITKEDARNLLIKCRRRIDAVTPLIKNSSDKCRYQHSRLGMLNAKQWFKFILIHGKHHLKQLDRIQKKFYTS